MENQKKKCSLKKHSEVDAISFCQDCKTYFCNKCNNHHSELLENHKTINLKGEKEIFINACKNHSDKLDIYCKAHNILCCTACVSKIKEGGYGQHNDCDVYHITKIKDEKRNKLKENINKLEGLSNQIEKSINEIKTIFEAINKGKENSKLKILVKFRKNKKYFN